MHWHGCESDAAPEKWKHPYNPYYKHFFEDLLVSSYVLSYIWAAGLLK
jgi:hypothetical protein